MLPSEGARSTHNKNVHQGMVEQYVNKMLRKALVGKAARH